MIRTTDGGVHWLDVPWSWLATPTLFAFDHRTLDGVASGDSGYVWVTDDGGASWTDHGSSSSTYTGLAIAAGEMVLLDSTGTVQRTHDGFSRETVVTDRTARLEQRDDEIVVHTDTADYSVRRGHAARRTAR